MTNEDQIPRKFFQIPALVILSSNESENYLIFTNIYFDFSLINFGISMINQNRYRKINY